MFMESTVSASKASLSKTPLDDETILRMLTIPLLCGDEGVHRARPRILDLINLQHDRTLAAHAGQLIPELHRLLHYGNEPLCGTDISQPFQLYRDLAVVRQCLDVLGPCPEVNEEDSCRLASWIIPSCFATLAGLQGNEDIPEDLREGFVAFALEFSFQMYVGTLKKDLKVDPAPREQRITLPPSRDIGRVFKAEFMQETDQQSLSAEFAMVKNELNKQILQRNSCEEAYNKSAEALKQKQRALQALEQSEFQREADSASHQPATGAKNTSDAEIKAERQRQVETAKQDERSRKEAWSIECNVTDKLQNKYQELRSKLKADAQKQQAFERFAKLVCLFSSTGGHTGINPQGPGQFTASDNDLPMDLVTMFLKFVSSERQTSQDMQYKTASVRQILSAGVQLCKPLTKDDYDNGVMSDLQGRLGSDVPERLLKLIIADVDANRADQEPPELAAAEPAPIDVAKSLMDNIVRGIETMSEKIEQSQMLALDSSCPERNWLLILIELVNTNYLAAQRLTESVHAADLRKLVTLLEDALETKEDRFKRAQSLAQRQAQYQHGDELYVFVMQLMSALAKYVNTCADVNRRVATWNLHLVLANIVNRQYKASDNLVREAVFALDHLASRPRQEPAVSALAGDLERCRELFHAQVVPHLIWLIKTRAWDFDTVGKQKDAMAAGARCLRKIVACHQSHVEEFYALEGHLVLSRLLTSDETTLRLKVELQRLLSCACNSKMSDILLKDPRFEEMIESQCVYGITGLNGALLLPEMEKLYVFAARLRGLFAVFLMCMNLKPLPWKTKDSVAWPKLQQIIRSLAFTKTNDKEVVKENWKLVVPEMKFSEMDGTRLYSPLYHRSPM